MCILYLAKEPQSADRDHICPNHFIFQINISAMMSRWLGESIGKEKSGVNLSITPCTYSGRDRRSRVSNTAAAAILRPRPQHIYHLWKRLCHIRGRLPAWDTAANLGARHRPAHRPPRIRDRVHGHRKGVW